MEPNAAADAVAAEHLAQAPSKAMSPSREAPALPDDSGHYAQGDGQVGAAAAQQVPADAYQQAATDYQGYYQHQEQAEHYQHHDGGDGDAEEADPNAETGLFIPGGEVNGAPAVLPPVSLPHRNTHAWRHAGCPSSAPCLIWPGHPCPAYFCNDWRMRFSISSSTHVTALCHPLTLASLLSLCCRRDAAAADSG